MNMQSADCDSASPPPPRHPSISATTFTNALHNPTRSSTPDGLTRWKPSAAGIVIIHTGNARERSQAENMFPKLCMSDGRVLAECSRRRPPRIDDVDGELCFQIKDGHKIPWDVKEGKQWQPYISFLAVLDI